REVTEDLLEPLTWEMWQMAQDISARDWLMLNTTTQAFMRNVIASVHHYDAIITPVLNKPPVKIGELDTREGMTAFAKSAQFTSFTAAINLSGQPAVSLPMGLDQAGLPLSIQLIGRPADESTLFSLCGQLEQSRPWADLRPPLATA
ncbi:MAG: amidase family protein, partial [Solirubrobacterales bacterium]